VIGAGGRGGDSLPTRVTATGIVLLPLLIPLGAGTVVGDVAVVLAIAVTLLWLGTRRDIHLPYLAPVALILLGGALGTFRSPVPLLSSLTLLQDLFLLAWAATVANAMRTPEGVRTILRAWCTAGPLWAVALILGVSAVGSSVLTSTSGRASFAFGDDNGLALYFVVTLALVIGSRRPQHPALRLGSIVVLLIATLLTGSLAGITGLAAGTLLVIVAMVATRVGLAPALVIALSGFLVLGFYWLNADAIAQRASRSSFTVVRNSIGREVQSKGSREVLSQETWKLFREGGIWGQGPAATKTLLLNSQAAYVKEAHDDWTAALVERGVIGVLGVGLLMVAFARRALGVIDPARLKAGFREVMPNPAVLIGVLAALLVYSVTHEVLHDRTAWAVLGFTAGLYGFGRIQAKEAVSA
jgi:hypothetical protein